MILEAYRAWGRTASRSCAACSRSRSGTRRTTSSSARATASGSSRSTTPSSTASSTSRPRSRRCCRSCRPIETDIEGFKDYLSFQFCLGGKTLFKGVQELLPGHFLRVQNGHVETRRYWEVYYEPDFDHTAAYFEEQIRSLMEESVALHLRADVPVGTYLSGGFDSSVVATPREPGARRRARSASPAASAGDEAYDESPYARDLAAHAGIELEALDIGPTTSSST